MTKAEFKTKWEEVLSQLEEQMDHIKIDTFFKVLTPSRVSEKENLLYFTSINNSGFFQANVNKYKNDWAPIVEAVFGAPYSIVVSEKDSDSAGDHPDEPILNEDLRLNPQYTFDTFVAGPNNQLALAAAIAIAQGNSKNYNPLFLYGGSGLGKTHLMHAIGQYVLKNRPKKKVIYVSSETFTTEFISSIQKGTQEKFKNKYRKVDYLLFDDVQFLAGKESTIDELFHTFDDLHSAGKQIVFTSDKAPKDLDGIPERLISRFQWGMPVDIQPPGYETRMAILKNKALMSDLEITSDVMDVLDIIAQNIQSNIRELEGAFTRILAHSQLTNETITKEFAKKVLSEIFNTKTKEITPSFVKETVSKYFGVKISDLESQKRTRSIAYPRQIAIYLIRTHTNYSLPNIGEFFGGRDHTTILHSYDKISEEIKTNMEVKNTVDNIERMLEE